MLRRISALVFLGRIVLLAQQLPSPPTFSKADMERLITDLGNASATNTISATQILAKRFSADMEKAAKAPVADRAAAMQKATDEYRKRVDAFNKGGKAGEDWAEGTGWILNPAHPELGFYQNLLNACSNGNKFATRKEDGTPVFQQVVTEGGSVVIHTYTPGLPLDEATPSRLSSRAVCPTLVRNAVKATQPKTAAADGASDIPKLMKICAAFCATLEWRNGRFEVLARDGKPATEFTVESFTSASIVMKRTELPHSGDYGLTAVYKGTFTEGSETAQGTVDFAWPGKPGYPHSANWTANWGASLAQARPPTQNKPEERCKTQCNSGIYEVGFPTAFHTSALYCGSAEVCTLMYRLKSRLSFSRIGTNAFT
jgi:hypothetical protein